MTYTSKQYGIKPWLVPCRGMNLESLLTKLRHAMATQQTAPELQLIAMSATMGGLEGLCNWLDAVSGLAFKMGSALALLFTLT
jgi:hypothetical protein